MNWLLSISDAPIYISHVNTTLSCTNIINLNFNTLICSTVLLVHKQSKNWETNLRIARKKQ